MSINLNTALTIDEQLRQWDNGTTEEAALAKYLRERTDDIRKDGYDEGFSDGYEACVEDDE